MTRLLNSIIHRVTLKETCEGWWLRFVLNKPILMGSNVTSLGRPTWWRVSIFRHPKRKLSQPASGSRPASNRLWHWVPRKRLRGWASLHTLHMWIGQTISQQKKIGICLMLPHWCWMVSPAYLMLNQGRQLRLLRARYTAVPWLSAKVT